MADHAHSAPTPASSTATTPAPSIIAIPSTTTGAVFPANPTPSTSSALSAAAAVPSASVFPSATAAPSTAPVPSTAATAAAAGVTVDYARVKLLCILMGPGTAVLRHALKCGTNKAPSVTLLDHLASLPDSSTSNYRHLNNDRRRRAFTSEERRKLGNDPSCQTFDITLLYKTITLACERVAPLNDDTHWKDPALMEGCLNKIKSERNACVHEWSQTIMDEDQFKNKVEELEEDFETALELVRDRYGVCPRETNTLIDTMKVQIQDVIQAFTERVIFNMTFEKKLALFKEVTPGHLKDRYRQFEYFDPLSFLLGSKERVHIQTVYIKLVLQQENTPLDIESSQLLRVLREECQPFPPVQDDRPRLAVVSGIAGSGKTTLLTFMVSEWRREECDRRVKHLEEYDIVLRILCRDKHAEDLETFLRRILPPSLSVFGEPLVNYLERCKVLFLIDGLDEMNQSSEKLVTNVMTLARCNKQFSIIVTSRQERVDWLLRRYEQDYRLSHLSIEGIPVAKRTEFALKYSTSSTNEEKLREFMAQHQDTELFDLPLNLLFVVTLFEDNPDSIKNHITQASLYTHFHEWCTEKLRVRIATHPTYGHTRPRTLKTRIKRVLKEMYQMALQGLLQDRLTLSEEDTERLEKCCKEEELPEQDVLGAFYTLRLFVNNRVREEQYSLPHKGLLEYFAARHIIQRLQDESLPLPGAARSLTHTSTQQQSHRPRPRLQDRVLSLINPIRSLFRKATQPRTPGAIRSVLHTITQQGTFRGQRNLFFHVAGLLAREKVPNRLEAIKEVIELVAETGARWREWLSLVENTDYNESFLQAIAHHVTENPPFGTVRITDSTLASAAALLPRTPPTSVELRLDREKVMVKDTLQRALTHHYCSDLSLHHHYEQPGNIPASDIVLRAIHRSRLWRFLGHLSGDCLALLPESLEWLFLAVSSDEHAGRLTQALNRAASSLRRLYSLEIHVPVSMVTPAAVVSPLPDPRGGAGGVGDGGVRLILSGVEENLVTEACQVAAALQPSKGYRDIGFPRGRMAAATWRSLLHAMAAAGVRVGRRRVWQGREEVLGCVWIPEETITWEEQRELEQLTHTLWGCRVYRGSDKVCFLPL